MKATVEGKPGKFLQVSLSNYLEDDFRQTFYSSVSPEVLKIVGLIHSLANHQEVHVKPTVVTSLQKKSLNALNFGTIAKQKTEKQSTHLVSTVAVLQ